MIKVAFPFNNSAKKQEMQFPHTFPEALQSARSFEGFPTVYSFINMEFLKGAYTASVKISYVPH